VAGAATLALIAQRRLEPARYSAAVAVGAIIAGWAFAQRPYLLPGLTAQEAAADDTVIVALLVSVTAGAVLLIPSLGLLFSLVLRGRFDEQPEEPGSMVRTARGEGAQPVAGGAAPPRRLSLAALGAAAVGVPLMLAADGGIVLAVGVVLVLAAVALGAAAALPLVAAADD
jgi:cytochrome d ubiquinol oxidase subunit II